MAGTHSQYLEMAKVAARGADMDSMRRYLEQELALLVSAAASRDPSVRDLLRRFLTGSGELLGETRKAADLWDQVVTIYVRLGDREEAISLLERVKRIRQILHRVQPEDPERELALADCTSTLGIWRAAKQEWLAALIELEEAGYHRRALLARHRDFLKGRVPAQEDALRLTERLMNLCKQHIPAESPTVQFEQRDIQSAIGRLERTLKNGLGSVEESGSSPQRLTAVDVGQVIHDLERSLREARRTE